VPWDRSGCLSAEAQLGSDGTGTPWKSHCNRTSTDKSIPESLKQELNRTYHLALSRTTETTSLFNRESHVSIQRRAQTGQAALPDRRRATPSLSCGEDGLARDRCRHRQTAAQPHEAECCAEVARGPKEAKMQRRTENFSFNRRSSRQDPRQRTELPWLLAHHRPDGGLPGWASRSATRLLK